MKRPTRTDVAKKAGVSVATVSYAFSDSPKISGQTRDQVRAAALELGYHPSQIARSLSTRQSMQLSMILNDISNPVYSPMIAGFESAAIMKGYLVNICNGRDHADKYFESVLTHCIDGILIEVLPYRFHIEKLLALLESGTKIVLFGNHGIQTDKAACFEIDYPSGMAQALGHLAALGHRKIVYLSGLAEKEIYDRRIEGFRSAARNLGLDGCSVLAPAESLSTGIADGKAMARRLLESGMDFTAVICTNDLMAFGALEAFGAADIAVPGDVSVIGIDNIYLSSVVTPPLTTIGADYFTIGRTAFELLGEAMTGNHYGYLLHQPSLIVRASTGPARHRR